MTEQPTTQQQGTHHFILTVQKAAPGGIEMNTFQGTFTVSPDMTRQDAYNAIVAEHDRQMPHLAGANVMFFALEPNQL